MCQTRGYSALFLFRLLKMQSSGIVNGQIKSVRYIRWLRYELGICSRQIWKDSWGTKYEQHFFERRIWNLNCYQFFVLMILSRFIFNRPNQAKPWDKKNKAKNAVNDQCSYVPHPASCIHKKYSAINKADYSQNCKYWAKYSFNVHNYCAFFFLFIKIHASIVSCMSPAYPPEG